MYLIYDVETTKEDHLTSKHCFLFFLNLIFNTCLCAGRCKCTEQQSWLFLFLSKCRTEPVVEWSVPFLLQGRQEKATKSCGSNCCFIPVALVCCYTLLVSWMLCTRVFINQISCRNDLEHAEYWNKVFYITHEHFVCHGNLDSELCLNVVT